MDTALARARFAEKWRHCRNNPTVKKPYSKMVVLKGDMRKAAEEICYGERLGMDPGCAVCYITQLLRPRIIARAIKIADDRI